MQFQMAQTETTLVWEQESWGHTPTGNTMTVCTPTQYCWRPLCCQCAKDVDVKENVILQSRPPSSSCDAHLPTVGGQIVAP